jgi:uncharacterized protein YcbK (DUF882 family)
MGDISEHFSRREFACNCNCGFDTVDTGTLALLEDIRMHFNAAVVLNSGCRCVAWNKKVGGEPNSFHTQARAADIAVAGVPPSVVADYVENGPLRGKGGVGRYNTFTHVDCRSNGPARWKG